MKMMTISALALLIGAAAPSAASGPSPRQWLGVWISGDKLIDIRSTPDGRLAIAGEAHWGGWDPERVANGAIHAADFSVEVAPAAGPLRFGISGTDGAAMAYDTGDALCHLTVALAGGRLVVDNPDECGGAYVTFTAEYRRRPPHRRP